MVYIIKLSNNGDIDEVNIYSKKKEQFNIENFKLKINIEDADFQELFHWDLESNKILYLFGLNSGEKKNENIHQLPINTEYNYYGDLFLCILDNNKYVSMDIEVFENIYNSLYLSYMDNEEESEDDIFGNDEITEVLIDDEEEDFNIDNYCDVSDEESEEDSNIPLKKVKKKKVIKTKEVDNKDILYDEKINSELKNETRIKCLDLLLTLVDRNKYLDYFKEVERHIFNYTIKTCIEKNIVPSWNQLFTRIYINKVRSLYTNINSESYVQNKRLLFRIQKNEFKPQELVYMNYQQLFPENWKELIDEKYRRDKVLYESKKEAMTDMYLCKRCKSRETCYYEVQTRSADEPMTIFITCLNCGNRWKN
jgi:transcription elongation factor S-II